MKFEFLKKLIIEHFNNFVEKGLTKIGIHLSGKLVDAAPRGLTGQLFNSIYYLVNKDEWKVWIIVHVEYAAIHEFGGEITPKQAQALTVPIHPDAIGKSADFFPGIFLVKINKKAFLAIKKGKREKLVLLFILSKRVHIPARPFMLPTAIRELDVLPKIFLGN